MIHGSMRHYPSGKKKKFNAWGKTRKKEVTATASFPTYTYTRGNTDHIPSRDDGSHNCSVTEKNKYTGTLVKGISTLHKSNAVPIIDEQEAKEHARMRR